MLQRRQTDTVFILYVSAGALWRAARGPRQLLETQLAFGYCLALPARLPDWQQHAVTASTDRAALEQ